MGPRTTNYQFSSQGVGLSREATRHDGTHTLSKLALELCDFRPSPNLGTTEALLPSAAAPAQRWRRVCAALPRRTSTAARTHDQPEAAPAQRAVDADGSAERERHRRGSEHARTTAHALRGRTSRRHLRAPTVFARCHLLERRKPVVATVALSVCLLTGRRPDASALRPRPRPLRRGSPSCPRAWLG